MLKSIVRLQLERIKQRIATNHEAALIYDDAVVDLIATRCTELESGGRMIDRPYPNATAGNQPRNSEPDDGRPAGARGADRRKGK